MQNLSTRSKVSSRRFYESFTSNKPCKSYVRDITSSSSDEFHEEYQGLILLTSSKTQEFVEPSRQRKLPVDPYLEDRQACLDIDSDQDHLVFVNSFLDTDPHWVLENDFRM
jgi:hypothetical protein